MPCPSREELRGRHRAESAGGLVGGWGCGPDRTDEALCSCKRAFPGSDGAGLQSSPAPPCSYGHYPKVVLLICWLSVSCLSLSSPPTPQHPICCSQPHAGKACSPGVSDDFAVRLDDSTCLLWRRIFPRGKHFQTGKGYVSIYQPHLLLDFRFLLLQVFVWAEKWGWCESSISKFAICRL